MKWRLYKEKLFWLRKKMGWSQEEAAYQCMASDKKQYHLWERGKILRPRKYSLQNIAKAFKLSDYNSIILLPTQHVEPKYESFYHYDSNNAIKLNDENIIDSDHKNFRLIVFDLDGTLLQNIDFSWRLVWDFIGDEEKDRKKGLLLYHSNKISYEEWCLWCANKFKEKRLNRFNFKEITKGVKLIENLHETLLELKSRGCHLAIISGGIDVFLDELIPDHMEIFDYTFINKLHFNKNNLLDYIEPTPFDFESKVNGIHYLCKKLKIDKTQAVFIGDSFNDKHVAGEVGLSIALQPNSSELKELFDIVIDSGNLKDIIPVIFDSKLSNYST